MLLVFFTTTGNATEFHITEDKDTQISTLNIENKDSLEQIIILSELYWDTNRNKSDSLIAKAFNIISEKESVDEILLAEAYYVLGKVLNYKKECKQSVIALNKSLVIKQEFDANNAQSLAKTLNYIGIVYSNLQQFDSAIYFYNKSKEKLINNDILDIYLYYAYLNTGISYGQLGKNNTAVTYFDTALIVLNQCSESSDSMILAGYYNNYALNTALTGKLKEANNYFEKAETIIINKYSSTNVHLAGINNNKGINSYFDYEFAKSALFLKKALDIYSTNNLGSKEIPLIYYNLSQVNQNTGDFLSAIDHCLTGLEYSPGNDLKLILNKSIASSYASIGNDSMADYYFKNALDFLYEDNINPKRDKDLFLTYADFLSTTTDNSLCLTYYKKALKSANTHYGFASDESATVLSQIGAFYLDNLNNVDSAIDYFTRSITLFDQNQDTTESDNMNTVTEGKAQVGYASAIMLKFKQSNQIELLYDADSIFSNVLDEMEQVINSLSYSEKLLLIEMMNPVYNLAIKNSLDLYGHNENRVYLEKILNFIERSKSSALLSAVNSEHALKTSDIPDNIFRYEHQLKDEINGLRQLLESENTEEHPNKNKTNFFETKLLILLNTYDSLVVSIEQNYPKYYSVKYNRDVISSKQIKQQLAEDEVLIEYQLTDSLLYIIAISNNEFEITQLLIDSSFYNSLNYIISIKNIDLSTESSQKFNDFKQHSHNLWKTLIKPANKLLSNNRLIIIPDGLLGYLPFDLLLEYDFESDSINYRDLPYLINSHPISYTYSATLKYNTYFNSGKNKPNHNILAFAPLYSGNDNNLKNLPFAKEEVKEIVNNQGGRAYYDHNATKYNFLQNAGSNNILHLAMHTIINDSLPMQSKLVFYNEKGDSTSNYMFTHEIFNLDLNASMVTLSACNTGSGKFRKGEGIMSLARGFVFAGVPAIVMTLWEVQDASGAVIMDKYYEYLSEGLTKDVALQQAKLSVLKDANMAKSHPFFWSAYIISGDASVIDVHSWHNYLYWIIAIAMIGAVVIISNYRSRKFSKKKSL